MYCGKYLPCIFVVHINVRVVAWFQSSTSFNLDHSGTNHFTTQLCVSKLQSSRNRVRQSHRINKISFTAVKSTIINQKMIKT